MAIRVLEETGLLPHLNPGVLSWQDFQRLKPVAPSMGMMLETTAQRLYRTKGAPHFGSPDKDPAVRLRVLEDAGRSNVPFTTGILIGIGETLAERAESIFAIRKVAREYRGIQEVIVQNFRAKPDTKMRDVPDAELDDLAATIAVTRLVLGSKARIQAPPNLVGAQYDLILRAGIDDWGGVSPLTPDHVNPERPWPAIDELADRTASAGFTLRERLTVYPPYLGEPWLDPRLARHVAALADPATGLAADGAMPRGLPWQEPDGGWGRSGRPDLHRTIDTAGRTEPGRPHRRPGRRPARRRRRRPGGTGQDRRRAAPRSQRGRRHLRGHPQHQLHQRLLHRLPVLRVRPAAHRCRRVHPLAEADRRPGRRSLGCRCHGSVHAGGHPSRSAGHSLFRNRFRSQASAA